MVHHREHSVSLMLAFRPVRIFLLCIGQMPFVERRKKDNTVTHKLNLRSFHLPLFLLIFVGAFIQFGLLTWGILSFFVFKPLRNPATTSFFKPTYGSLNNERSLRILNYTNVTTSWERLTVQQQYIPIVVVWTWMFSAVLGNFHVITHGHAYTHFFNYWHRVVQAMDMDVTRGIRHYLYVENCFFLLIILIVVLTFLVGYFKEDIYVVTEISRVMSHFVLRNFGVQIQELGQRYDKFYYHLASVYGLFIILFSYVGSRTNIVQFVFFCRTLTNSCTLFNERLLAVLTDKHEGHISDEEKRKVHAHLFRDHLIVVQLFRMTESLFAPILLPYYLFQIAIITLQLYNLVSLRRTSIYETEAFNQFIGQPVANISELIRTINPDKDREEWARAIQSLCLSVAFIIQGWVFVSITTSSAARAAEHAGAAFKIIRRNGYITCDTKKERNMMHSLVFSFARNNPIRLTTGGYFPVDKALLPALIGTILNYIVAVYTLKPDVWVEESPELISEKDASNV